MSITAAAEYFLPSALVAHTPRTFLSGGCAESVMYVVYIRHRHRRRHHRFIRLNVYIRDYEGGDPFSHNYRMHGQSNVHVHKIVMSFSSIPDPRKKISSIYLSMGMKKM